MPKKRVTGKNARNKPSRFDLLVVPKGTERNLKQRILKRSPRAAEKFRAKELDIPTNWKNFMDYAGSGVAGGFVNRVGSGVAAGGFVKNLGPETVVKVLRKEKDPSAVKAILKSIKRARSRKGKKIKK